MASESGRPDNFFRSGPLDGWTRGGALELPPVRPPYRKGRGFMSIYGCTPAEFEKQSAIILGCNELLPFHPQAMVDIVATLIERIPLVAIVDSEEQRKHLITLLCDWGLPAHLLHFV